jgi:hypothetical protein
MFGDFGGDGLMRHKLCWAILPFVITAATTAHAEPSEQVLPKARAPVMVGDVWKVGASKLRSADIWIYILGKNRKLMREARIDTKRSKFDGSPYPLAVSKDHYFELTVEVSLSADGAVTQCTMKNEAASSDVNAHICTYIANYIAFSPALNAEGIRIAQSVELVANYAVDTTSASPLPIPSNNTSQIYDNPITPPRPLEPITIKTFGLDWKELAKIDVSMIGFDLDVDAEGKVSHCYLDFATYDDAIDRNICATAKALSFSPATNEKKIPIPFEYRKFVFNLD